MSVVLSSLFLFSPRLLTPERRWGVSCPLFDTLPAPFLINEQSTPLKHSKQVNKTGGEGGGVS